MGLVEDYMLGKVVGQAKGCSLELLLGLVEGYAMGNVVGEAEGSLLGSCWNWQRGMYWVIL